jgi:hypothetical protein
MAGESVIMGDGRLASSNLDGHHDDRAAFHPNDGGGDDEGMLSVAGISSFLGNRSPQPPKRAICR